MSYYPYPAWPGTPPGWYGDPWEVGMYRWWDGYAWTSFVGGGAVEVPAGPGNGAGIKGGGVALVGTLVALLLSGVMVLPWVFATHAANRAQLNSALVSNPWVLLFSELGLWIGWVGACIYASRHNGSGSLKRDFGLAVPRWRDIGIGLGGGVVGRVVSLVVAVIVILISMGSQGLHSGGQSRSVIGFTPHGWLAWAVIVLITCVGAPIVEELFFRGLVQGALVRRWGAAWGVSVTAVLFACAHVTDEGWLAIPVLIPMAFLLGWMRWRYKSLGPGMVAHITFNTLGLAALLTVTGIH